MVQLGAGVSTAVLLTFLLSGPVGWWAGLLSVPLLLGSVAAALFLPGLVEYFLVRRHSCPTCGARDWSRGYTRGFGL
jgi:hypothetical protein